MILVINYDNIQTFMGNDEKEGRYYLRTHTEAQYQQQYDTPSAP